MRIDLSSEIEVRGNGMPSLECCMEKTNTTKPVNLETYIQ